MSTIQIENSAWDTNPGPEYGRRLQNHGAMDATPKI